MKKIKCPRCNEKMLDGTQKCPNCGLVFERLKFATNKAGKKKIKEGRKDKVVYVKKLPSDIQKWKLFVLCLFTGMFGGHCFYVGRILKGVLMAFGGCVFFVGFIFMMTSKIPEAIFTMVGLTVGITFIAYLLDLFDILFSKFKVPVYIDTTGGEEK